MAKSARPKPSAAAHVVAHEIPVETRGGARKGAGRKPFAALGRETRDCRVMVRFTASQYAALVRLADDEGTSVAELVAERTVFWLGGELGGAVEGAGDEGES